MARPAIVSVKARRNEHPERLIRRFTRAIKKQEIDKLYGENPKIVTAPSINGARNITKNLLFNNAIKS